MEAIFYVTIFLIGTLFGSFYTLAVYRIPKRQDILYTHSYCPNCNHKLGILDLFPIISYIALGGKCRYCKEKIRPRYLILEILTGILFITIAYLMKLSVFNLSTKAIMSAIFMALYVTYLVLISGIDKENRKIDKAVNIYGIVISIIYMIYLCIVEGANIYRYAIYLVLYILIVAINARSLKKHKENLYVSGILLSIVTMIVFTGEFIVANSIIVTLFASGLYLLIYKIKNKVKKVDKQVANEIRIGFELCIANAIIFIMILFYNQYIL